jgi:hypothetical protein
VPTVAEECIRAVDFCKCIFVLRMVVHQFCFLFEGYCFSMRDDGHGRGGCTVDLARYVVLSVAGEGTLCVVGCGRGDGDVLWRQLVEAAVAFWLGRLTSRLGAQPW